jgi:F-type H+-transporting ATPase subunit alpha
VQAFAQFGSDLDSATQQQLTRGARLVEILKQGQYSPEPVELQIVHILAGNSGSCDTLSNNDIRPYITDLTQHFKSSQKELLSRILAPKASMKKDNLQKDIIAAISKFRESWSQ